MIPTLAILIIGIVIAILLFIAVDFFAVDSGIDDNRVWLLKALVVALVVLFVLINLGVGA